MMIRVTYNKVIVAYSIFVQTEAQQDIQKAYDWYEEQLPSLGEEFL